jgi:hypothetical protein
MDSLDKLRFLLVEKDLSLTYISGKFYIIQLDIDLAFSDFDLDLVINAAYNYYK